MNISDADMETFINRCERLNREVSAMPELGETTRWVIPSLQKW